MCSRPILVSWKGNIPIANLKYSVLVTTDLKYLRRQAYHKL